MKEASHSRLSTLAVVMMASAVAAVILHAQSPQRPEPAMTYFPTEGGPGVPAYARIEMVTAGPLVHHDDEWAAIPFYRELACVPLDLNLLDFVDFAEDSSGQLRVFSCPMTVEGHTVGINPFGPPRQTISTGTGNVPIWFVQWDTLKAALSDGGEYNLTMLELEGLALPGPDVLKKGTATFFKETLLPLGGGGPRQTTVQIVARGFTDDGLQFDLQSVENLHTETHDIDSRTVTSIRFRH